MANVSIKKSKICIESEDFSELAYISNIIGTSHIDPQNQRVLRCKCSIPNLQRIKKALPSARLCKDSDTRLAIQQLMVAQDEWVRESEYMRAAKAGREDEDIKYTFQFNPYTHQRRGFYFMHASKRAAIFGDCGIGKTAIAASFIESLKKSGQLRKDEKALVICPISIIRQAWMKDIEKFTKLKAESLYEPSKYKAKEKRKERLTREADVYIASFSLLLLLEEELRDMKFKLIIVDESSKIKNPQSKTFKALKEVSWKAQYRYIMSGTPAPNGPIDLWSQFFFIDEGMTLEPSLVDFRHEYYKQIDLGSRERGTYKATIWVPKPGMPEKINEMIEPRSVRFKASECLDLPEQTFITRTVPMTEPQAKLYDEMAENLFVDLGEEGTVTARVSVTKLMKLREITGGFVINDNGEACEIGKNPKMDELDDLLDQIMASGENKAIVWVQYQWEAKTIIKKYQKKYGATGLYGGIPQSEKDYNIDRFMDSKSHRLLVCHPKSAAHGLTLTAAAYSIYYSLSYDFEDYYQSSKRIHRPGQKHPTFYYFLVAEDSIDETLLQTIQDKKNLQDILIDGSVDPRRIVGIRDRRTKGGRNATKEEGKDTKENSIDHGNQESIASVDEATSSLPF